MNPKNKGNAGGEAPRAQKQEMNSLDDNACINHKNVSVEFLDTDLWVQTGIPRPELEEQFLRVYALEKIRRPAESDAELLDHALMTFANATVFRLRCDRWPKI